MQGASTVSDQKYVLQRVGLEIINIMNDDGSLNASAGAYSGLDRFEVRKGLWADMQACPLYLSASHACLNGSAIINSSPHMHAQILLLQNISSPTNCCLLKGMKARKTGQKERASLR